MASLFLYLFILLLYITKCKGTWEEIPTPLGFESVFIPSSVHRDLKNCLNDLEELRQKNEMLLKQISQLRLQLSHKCMPQCSNMEEVPLTPRLLGTDSRIKATVRSNSAPPIFESVQQLSRIDEEMQFLNSEDVNQNISDHHHDDANHNMHRMVSPPLTAVQSLVGTDNHSEIEFVEHPSSVDSKIKGNTPTPTVSLIESLSDRNNPLRFKRKQKKKMRKHITREDDNEDVDQLLAEYRAKAPPVQRKLIVYESIDSKTIHELEKDLIMQYPSDLILVQTLQFRNTSPIHTFDSFGKGKEHHPDYPQYPRVIGHCGILSGILSATLDFTQCFKIKEDGSHITMDPPVLLLWIKHIISVLCDERGNDITRSYYKKFKTLFFPDQKNLPANAIETKLLAIMDFVDSQSRNKTKIQAINLDIFGEIDVPVLFADARTLDLASQLFRFLMDQLLLSTKSEMLSTHRNLTSSVQFFGVGNETEMESILDCRVTEFCHQCVICSCTNCIYILRKMDFICFCYFVLNKCVSSGTNYMLSECFIFCGSALQIRIAHQMMCWKHQNG